MPVSTPNGYLDFTNATPRATKVIATSNVGIGFNNPLHALDVDGSANVGALTATTLSVTNTPLATLAANLVTYDSSTGVFQDSGGLFSNKLAVVSEQPPSALGGASTTVEKHGTYKLTASTGTPQNAFDKATNTSWLGSSSYTGGDGTGLYVGATTLATGLKQGDWIAVELPYKATLRHLTLTAADAPTTGALPNKANLYATNDSLTWTELKYWEAGETTVIVNASAPYKKFALVTTQTQNNNSTLEIGQLKLFCESFSVDGGKIEMATSAVTGGETVMDQTTGHAREPAVLKKYPEVALSSNVQSGYVTNVSSQFTTYYPYNAFDGKLTASDSWISADSVYNYTSPWAYTGSANLGTDSGGNATNGGEYIQIELPNKILLNRIALCVNRYTGIQAFTLYGSNDGVSWTELLDDALPSSVEYDNFELRRFDVNTATYYKHFGLVAKTGRGEASSHTYVSLQEWELYGYEETNTTGDTSLDTTITSKYNTPDLTSASLYLDGLKGSTATDYSGNDVAVTATSVTWDSTEKAWTLSGAATSNIVTADLGFEGDQPHSISAWVKADQLNGRGLFHLGTAEGEGDAASRVGFVDDSHISWGGEDHYFSNAEWHNVTYTYNGEGSDKKLYLDGRLVGTAKNEDTFGDYPPFAMSDYSQYGYTASASSEYTPDSRLAWKAYDANDNDTSVNAWMTADPSWDNQTPSSPTSGSNPGTFTAGGVNYTGHWNKLELPHKLKIDYVYMSGRFSDRVPYKGVFLGSNDDSTWEVIKSFNNTLTWTAVSGVGVTTYVTGITNNNAYKYILLVVEQIIGPNTRLWLNQIQYHGHRENDLVRFPDPTNVLKYPHVAMTGPAQRGYVATASTETPSDSAEAWRALDSDTTTFWKTSEMYNSDGTYGYQGANNSLGGHSGEYLILEFPRKILLSSVGIHASTSQRIPNSMAILGSDDNSSWTTLAQQSSTTYTSNETSISVNASTAYKYLAVVVRTVTGNGLRFQMHELRLYGTEPEDVVARIGDGYEGKVRNLRVFSTALSQDRVQEIFDADKDEFGLAKSSVSVYRGHLGIGTTEPKAALTVMDEVGELEEFPPRAMTDYETYMEGHGVFRIIESSHQYGGQEGWRAFEDVWGNGNSDMWISGSSPLTYNADGTPTSNAGTINGVLGEYLILESPYKVKMSHVLIHPRGHNSTTESYSNPPKTGKIWGSNELNGLWTEIATYENLNFGATLAENLDGQHPQRVEIRATEYYKYIAFQVTVANHTLSTTTNYTNIQELRYFGTREQGASTLHNGELTLTRNLTVPRIGPALDADDTPRRDRLVVEYNTSTNNTENGVVKDTSGRGLDGLTYNGAYYDASEKALRFDGTDDYITTSLSSTVSGEWAHTVSFWFNLDTLTNDKYFTFIGAYTARQGFGTLIYGTNKFVVTTLSTELHGTTVVQSSRWYHAVVVYRGSTVNSTNVDIYLDGVKEAISSEVSPNTIDITSPKLNIGTLYGTSHFTNGSISNFKLYDVALTADEVKRLYDMGRHGNVIAKPLYITAPLHAPGVPIQMVTKQVHDRVAYSAADLVHISALDISITPKFANSKIKIEWNVSYEVGHDNVFRIYRDGSLIGYNYDAGSSHHWSGVAVPAYDQNTASTPSHIHIVWVDTPNTTSPITYKLYKKDAAGSGFDAFYLNRPLNGNSNNNESGVSHAIVTEIAQ